MLFFLFPAAALVSLLFGIRLGTKASRWACAISLALAAVIIALNQPNLASHYEPTAMFGAGCLALFLGIGFLGPAIFEKRVGSVVTSLLLTLVGSFAVFWYLLANACAHGPCL